MAQRGGGTICGVVREPHQAKAAYRLLDNPGVTHESVTASHVRWTLEETRAAGVYLLIEDTTTLNYQGLESAKGLGPIGADYTRGLLVHSCLVTRADLDTGSHTPLGLLGQTAWARRVERPKGRRKSNGRGKECNHARQTRGSRGDSESGRWTGAMAQAGGPIPGTQWIYVADRESDIYEVFQSCRVNGSDFVVRAAHDRALAQEHRSECLKAAAARAPVLGETTMELPDGGRVKMRVRAESLTLKGPPRPGGALEDHAVNLVVIERTDVKAGEESLRWVLLTSLAVESLASCLRVVRAYKCRCLIEEFHKALKTGLKVEESQLSDARRLMALTGILSVVAVSLLRTRAAARQAPETLLDDHEADQTMVKVLEATHPPPAGKKTRKWFHRGIARLGGFMGRKGDGDPGWLTLWRGWQTLQVLARGYELAQDVGKD